MCKQFTSYLLSFLMNTNYSESGIDTEGGGGGGGGGRGEIPP